MRMHFAVENVSDFWTATEEQQLKVKTGSCTSVAKASKCQSESRMKGGGISQMGDGLSYLHCVLKNKLGLAETV